MPSTALNVPNCFTRSWTSIIAGIARAFLSTLQGGAPSPRRHFSHPLGEGEPFAPRPPFALIHPPQPAQQGGRQPRHASTFRSDPPAIPRAALVTGGAQRIGRAIALAWPRRASTSPCTATPARRRRSHLRRHPLASAARAVLLQADLAQEAETAALLPRAVAALGPIGVLVNNASRFERDEWHDATRASWDAHLEPNLRAPFVLMQHFARLLPRHRRGRGHQHARPAGLVDHPAFRLLHRVQGRVCGR